VCGDVVLSRSGRRAFASFDGGQTSVLLAKKSVRAHAMCAQPGSSHASLMLLGSPEGKVWATADQGETWHNLLDCNEHGGVEVSGIITGAPLADNGTSSRADALVGCPAHVVRLRITVERPKSTGEDGSTVGTKLSAELASTPDAAAPLSCACNACDCLGVTPAGRVLHLDTSNFTEGKLHAVSVPEANEGEANTAAGATIANDWATIEGRSHGLFYSHQAPVHARFTHLTSSTMPGACTFLGTFNGVFRSCGGYGEVWTKLDVEMPLITALYASPGRIGPALAACTYDVGCFTGAVDRRRLAASLTSLRAASNQPIARLNTSRLMLREDYEVATASHRVTEAHLKRTASALAVKEASGHGSRVDVIDNWKR
jgi:hypothetical protein